MKKTFSDDTLKDIFSKLEISESDSSLILHRSSLRNPIHVLYGGAHLFNADTPRKLGAIALKSVETYAPDFAEFARSVWLEGAEVLPQFSEIVRELDAQFEDNPEKMKTENYAAWFALTIYARTIEKLRREPVEDFRIDFEDGYGIRADAEEDTHAVSASDELAKSFLNKTITPFCGFRPKSFAPETYKRAVRTLDLFLTNLIEKTKGKVPENFVVTLPKITCRAEVEVLAELLSEFEKRSKLENDLIKIELMIETPQAILDENGAIALRSLVHGARGRCVAAHFGAYDFTASLNIAGAHQHLRHEACNFARQMMQVALSPLGVRLADSVTTEMPFAVHTGENLSQKQIAENRRAVQTAWSAHFKNVTSSLINGFYQSWDLHPAQLPARYAAVYSFFLQSKDEQGRRLKNFLAKATQAAATGNQFDDAASAQGILNFFARASSCGALTENEIAEATNLTADELRDASFAKIIENRERMENGKRKIKKTVNGNR